MEIAVDSEAAVETAADLAEAVEASAPRAAKCSTLSAPSVARKRKFPSSRAVRVRYTAGIVSLPTARHVVAAVAAVAADMTAVVAAIAVPAVTNFQSLL